MEVTSNIIVGDVLAGLATLPDASVHCCVTSPPYFGLRDYQVAGQLGLEKTPDEYVAAMVNVFREVRRVLREDAVCFLNVGDSYASKWACKRRSIYGEGSPDDSVQRGRMADGLKEKDLIGIPWLLAFALRADGWYLRSEIIWRKPAPMPESVTDRPTKSHEQVFLLAKSERYFYDAAAIAEPLKRPDEGNRKTPAKFGGADKWQEAQKQSRLHSGNEYTGTDTGTRNKRSVWTISTRSFKGAHFACFPPDLVEPCILAGTSAHGCCSECGAPWQRITNRKKLKRNRPNDFTKRTGEDGTGNSCSNSVAGVSVETLGWEPTCKCSAEVVPCTVLDPFSGSGTTGAVANVLGRNYVGTELNPDYAAMWEMRLADIRKWWAKKNGKPVKKQRAISSKQGDLF